MPVPLGETGQLYVSSKNLCDGYVGKNNNNFGLNKVCIQTFFSSRCILQNLEPNLLFYLTFINVFLNNYVLIWNFVLLKVDLYVFPLSSFHSYNFSYQKFSFKNISVLKKYEVCDNYCYITSQKNLLLRAHKNFDDVPSYKLLCEIGANNNFYIVWVVPFSL